MKLLTEFLVIQQGQFLNLGGLFQLQENFLESLTEELTLMNEFLDVFFSLSSLSRFFGIGGKEEVVNLVASFLSLGFPQSLQILREVVFIEEDFECVSQLVFIPCFH